MYLLTTLNFTLSVAGLILALITVALFVDYFAFKGQYFSKTIENIAWPAVMLVSMGSVAMTLVYSEYFGFIPCSLCWLQRIALYPQALISVAALKLRDRTYFPVYGIWLSVFGFLVAIYHYIYQHVPKETLSSGIVPCLADGSNADCAVKVIDTFGFVTFPLLSAITFAFLIVTYLYMLRSNKVKEDNYPLST